MPALRLPDDKYIGLFGHPLAAALCAPILLPDPRRAEEAITVRPATLHRAERGICELQRIDSLLPARACESERSPGRK